jgi:hypothetical protein
MGLLMTDPLLDVILPEWRNAEGDLERIYQARRGQNNHKKMGSTAGATGRQEQPGVRKLAAATAKWSKVQSLARSQFEQELIDSGEKILISCGSQWVIA